MIPAFLLAMNLAAPESCHTTALLVLDNQYTDKQIERIVEKVFPPWTFVVCRVTVAKAKHGIEVRYGPQTRPVSSSVKARRFA